MESGGIRMEMFDRMKSINNNYHPLMSERVSEVDVRRGLKEWKQEQRNRTKKKIE